MLAIGCVAAIWLKNPQLPGKPFGILSGSFNSPRLARYTRSGDSAKTPPCEPQMKPGFGEGCAHCGQFASGISYSPVMSPTPPFTEIDPFLCCSEAVGLTTKRPVMTMKKVTGERERLRTRPSFRQVETEVYSS